MSSASPRGCSSICLHSHWQHFHLIFFNLHYVNGVCLNAIEDLSKTIIQRHFTAEAPLAAIHVSNSSFQNPSSVFNSSNCMPLSPMPGIRWLPSRRQGEIRKTKICRCETSLQIPLSCRGNVISPLQLLGGKGRCFILLHSEIKVWYHE